MESFLEKKIDEAVEKYVGMNDSRKDEIPKLRNYFKDGQVKKTLDLYNSYQKPELLERIIYAITGAIFEAEYDGKVFERTEEENKEIVDIIAKTFEEAEGKEDPHGTGPTCLATLALCRKYPDYGGFLAKILSMAEREKDERCKYRINSVASHILRNIDQYIKKEKGLIGDSKYVSGYCKVYNSFNYLGYMLRRLEIPNPGTKAWGIFESYDKLNNFEKFVSNFYQIVREKIE